MTKQFLIALLVVFTYSCSNNDNHSINQKTGTLKGKVTTINTHKAVGGALVFAFDDKNNIYRAHTNATGDFELLAPIGNRKLHIQTGDGSNFRTKVDIVVQENQTQQLEESLLRLEQTARIAYVEGNYDSIENIITNLGYDAESISFNQLSNYAIISQYDIIFLNCGSITKNDDISQHPNVTSNLAQFVTNGGSLYASDWAVAYLIGGDYFTEECNAAGGFIPDTTLCSIADGSESTLTTYITNSALANATGLSALDILYDLGGWQKINSVDETFWEVLVRETGTEQPLMIRTNHFSNPSVVGNRVGNSQNIDWVTICHQPDENSNTSITITIEATDWPAHTAHGDSIGTCAGNGMSGTIYYTTFHNHPNIGNSQFILEQVILNL